MKKMLNRRRKPADKKRRDSTRTRASGRSIEGGRSKRRKYASNVRLARYAHGFSLW
jgi:hypothetical protein